MPKPTDAKKVLEMLRGAPKPAVSRLDMGFKDVTKRMPELQQAAKLYEQGKITREQYYAIVDQLKPVTPYEFIPKPATAEEALAALTSDKVKDFGRTDVLTPGETILSRLDIPAYSKKGTWVTSQHRLKPPADEPKTIYTPTMMLEGETKMMPGTGAARRVAKGEKQKSSFATIRGAYKPGSDEEAVERAIEALRSKDYAQIGYDPERRGFFYDRRTMEPIIGTEEGIIQIGPLVLGKKPIRGKPEDFEYKEGGAVHMQDGGDPTQMFNFNPMAAKAAEQERRRREAVEAKRYKSVMGTTPQDLLRRVEPPPAEMTETPQSVMPTTLDRAVVGGLRALGAPAPQARGINQLLSKSVGMLVPDPERIYNQMSEAVKEDDYSKMIGPSIDAAIGYVPLIGPAARLAMPPVKAATTSALDFGRTAGREMLRPVDQAMFGEGPLGNALSMVAPLNVNAPVSKLGFYNPIEETATTLQRKQGPGQAFLNEFTRAGISKQRLEDAGLAQKLAATPNVTREEVQAMTKGTMPDVEEVVLSRSVIPPYMKGFANLHMPDLNVNDYRQINQLRKLADERYQKALAENDLDAAEFAMKAEEDINKFSRTHSYGTKPGERLTEYHEYQEPGGKNYREVLLKAPSSEKYDDNFRSSHWSDPNVISHIRMNDRVDADNKNVLFIEELQSDWAQEGRKKGFAPKNFDQQIKEGIKRLEGLRDQLAAIKSKLDQPGLAPDERNILMEEYGTLTNKQAEEIDWGNNLIDAKNSGIPEGQFVKNTNEWVDLSLKNIIRRAVDEGYDRVAFIDGYKSFLRFPQGADGKSTEAGMRKFYDEVIPSRLKALVGKDNVRTIPGITQQRPLDVSLQGNRYYVVDADTDIAIPDHPGFRSLERAEQYLDELYSKSKSMDQIGFDITPEIREKFSKPIPYKKGGAVYAAGGAVSMQDGGSPLDQFYQPVNPMARRAAEQERMRQEIARRRAEELARQQTPLDTSLPGPPPQKPGLPSMADLKGAFERRVMPVISEAKQTAMTGGILGDLARAYGEASVPVNQAMVTALGRPFEQERPPAAPPEMTVPTAFERRGDIFQQLAGQAIGDPANLLDPGILRGLEAGARAVKPSVMRGLEAGTQAVKPFAKTAAEMVEEMAMKGVPGTDAMQLRMGILPETPKLPSLTDEALPAPKIEGEAPTGGMSIRPEQLELPVSQVVKRGEEVPPMTTPPTPEQVAAARADTRMGADIVADRLNVIVPEAERVLGGIYKPGRPDGGKWSDLTPEELSKNLPGFPGTDADLNRMWDETLSEVSQAARDAVARTGATWQGFPAADFDVAMRLPLRNQLWYELSGEAFVDRVPDASLRESLILLDLVGATSARARPEENLERALAILSQRLRGVPVDVDITIPSTVTQALNRSGTNISSDLANKTGMFSDTIALTGGIPVRYPISVNDVWEGRTYGITDEALSKNQPLHEVFAKYQNKVRDFVNENGDFPYPVQSWNVQALKWVKKRFDDLGIDPLGPASLQGSDYAAEFDKIVNKLERAGIKVPNGQITRDVLLNPKTADALRPTTPGFRRAPKATVEFGTLLTPAGQRAAQIYEAAKNTGDELTQQEYRNILLSAMRDSSRGKPTPWESLARVASDEALSVTRIAAPTQDDPFSISGTFMGAAGPNIRIPLKELTPDQIAYFNSVAGLGLKQKAMAAAEILRLDPDMSLPQGFVPTHSIRFDFSGRVPETMLTDFAKALGEGFEISAMRYPDGMVFDINPRFGDAGPEAATHEAINAATSMLQSTYNAKNLEVFPSAYRSEYGKNYVEDPGNGSEYNRIIKDTLKGWNNEAATKISQLAGRSVNAKNINAFLAGKLENLPIDRSKVASASELSSIQGKAKTIRKGLRQRLSDHDAALKAFNDIGLAVDSRMAAAIPKWDKRAAAMAKREQTKQGPETEMAKGGRVHISNNLDTMLLELMRNKRYG